MVLTAVPVDATSLPVLAKALVKALRAELLFAFAAARAVAALPLASAAEYVAAVTVPAGAFETAVPAGVAPEVDT
jgi:hypothetical protein